MAVSKKRTGFPQKGHTIASDFSSSFPILFLFGVQKLIRERLGNTPYCSFEIHWIIDLFLEFFNPLGIGLLAIRIMLHQSP